MKIGDEIYSVCAPKEDIYLDSVGPEFDPTLVKVFRSLIHDDFYCLDIGANIGCTTILFSELAKHVDSYEPSPTTFKFLKEILRRLV